MFDPIRSFFTTPPKRAVSSLGAGLSGEDDTSPMPAFQKAWKDGATFDDLFGPTPFTLYGAVGRSGAENHRPDVAKVETFLGDAGYYKPLTNDGPSGWHSTNLDTAIKSFQKDNGLEVDGLLKPGGPTIGKIGSLLGSAADVDVKSEPEKYDPWEQKVGGNDPGDPKKLQPPEWWKPLGEDDDEPDSPDLWPNTVKATLPEGVPVYPDSKVADNSQMFAPRYPRPNSPEEQAKYKQEYDAWLKENWEKIQKNQVLVGQGLPPMDIPAPPLRPGEERPDPMDPSTWPGGRGNPAPAPIPQPQPAPQPAPGPDIVFGPHGGPTIRLPQTTGPTFPYPVGRDLVDILAGRPSKPSSTPPRNPFDGHTISEDGAREHDSYAANLVRDSNPDETARYLKNVITWNGDQGRGDVADLLGRFAKVDQGKAKTLQDALHRAAGERIPFRIAPLGQGIAAEAAGEAGTVELPNRNPWGSAQDANRWEAGTMAKALLGKSDYKDAATHFAGEFKRDPAAARAYTAAIFEDMAATSPQQAMQFVGSMREAGLAAADEKKPEAAPAQTPEASPVQTAPESPPPSPAPAPVPNPSQTPTPTPQEPQPSSKTTPAQGPTDSPPKSSPKVAGETVSPDFLDAIYSAEQGGRVGEQRKSDEVATGSTGKGKFQILDGTLRGIGWKDANGNWTAEAAKNGVKSNEDFLKSEQSQNAAAQVMFAQKEKSLKIRGAFENVGQVVQGLKGDFKVTESGLLAAAHRDGEGTVIEYLKHQKKNDWKSDYGNLDPSVKDKLDIKDSSGKVIRTAEDRFRAIETRIRTFENVKR